MRYSPVSADHRVAMNGSHAAIALMMIQHRGNKRVVAGRAIKFILRHMPSAVHKPAFWDVLHGLGLLAVADGTAQEVIAAVEDAYVRVSKLETGAARAYLVPVVSPPYYT